MNKYRRVDDRVFTVTTNARVDYILAYIRQERLPAYVTSKTCIIPQSSFDGVSRKVAA